MQVNSKYWNFVMNQSTDPLPAKDLLENAREDGRRAPSGASGTLTGRVSSKKENQSNTPQELDPLGKDQHEVGAKLDHGKLRPALVLGGFSKALVEVSKVGTYGAQKYTDNGWKGVPNGKQRYRDAALRHWLKEMNGAIINEEDGDVFHLAQTIWNLLAVLELELGSK